MLVLGIETSCDETACAVVQDGREVLSNVVSSQVDLHKAFGGVVPELACRRHIEAFGPVLEEALEAAGVGREDIDLVAVAQGPGLIGALLIGLNAAKGLSLALGKPLVAVNHVEAHLYAAMMPKLDELEFPALGVVISGGHTALIRVMAVGDYKLIGTTVDDAVGEAFDKVGALLGLPYPGGPAIEALARSGEASRFALRAGRVKGRPYDFSFSGLKTSVLYTVKGPNASKGSPRIIPDDAVADVAASFQEVALGDIVKKAVAAAGSHGCRSIIVGGGVSNNQRLREMFAEATDLEVLWPPPGLSLDNAAMIAGLGYAVFQRRGGDGMDVEPLTRVVGWR